MRVIRHLAGVPARLPRVALTLGNFDGTHLGHQAIVRRAVAEAAALGGRSVALTFHPHPIAVLAPERAPTMLQSLHDRLESLRALGVDTAVVQRFTRRFAEWPPEGFVREFLARYLDVRHVVVGYDVNFGRNRAGSVDTLRTLGATDGFAVDVVGAVHTSAGELVSSSAVRRALAAGDLALVARLLGRPHALRGRVVVGDRRGRTIGFPTANLHVPGRVLLPPDGVYAVRATLDGAERAGVMNVGVRPTFAGVRRTVEVHLLDFAADVYGRWMRVALVERLRGERKFAGVDALRAAIADDVAHARRVLGA